MAEFSNQIVGLIRFSYPAKGGFAKSFDSDAQAEAFLYDPDRLERRFDLFEKMCLPALRQQSDPDFICAIVTGENLPATARDRLTAHLATLADGRLITLPPKPHYGAMKAALRQVDIDGASHRTTFRLDDDDALDTGFVARLKSTAAGVRDLALGEPIAISFNHGFYVQKSDTGNQVFDATERTPLSVGTALVAPADHPDNVYARNHRFLPQFFNTFSQMQTPAWIRTIHADNDSDPFIQGRSHEMTADAIAADLKTRFAQSLDDLLAL